MIDVPVVRWIFEDEDNVTYMQDGDVLKWDDDLGEFVPQNSVTA